MPPHPCRIPSALPPWSIAPLPAIATLTAKIEAVTPAQVRDLAERLFRHQKPAFSAVGHIGQMAGYDAITRHFA